MTYLPELLQSLLPVATALAVVLASSLGSAKLQAAGDRLAPCPDTPNCVSTLATDDGHAIEPIAYTGSLDDAQARLLDVMDQMPRRTVVTVEDDYLHVEFRSLVFRFVDDVEFVLDDEAKLIHFRSAARLGHSDLGVNRRRMEQIRRAFDQATSQTSSATAQANAGDRA